jgi:hypothetical protein
MVQMTEENSTLRTGNYSIEVSNGPSIVYKIEEKSGAKEWVCTCPDPEAAMLVVEGLILVENKRFYYPESTPKLQVEGAKVTEA